jgi:hypothetical protein
MPGDEIMSEDRNSGISKAMFVGGLIIAVLVSGFVSIIIAIQLQSLRGPKGEKGDTGPQGLQGPQGPPGPATVFAQWSLTWYTLSGGLQWGASVGTETWGAVFDHDFGNNSLFQGYSDYVGFQATMRINMNRDGPIHFEIGSDDGARFYIDDGLWLDNWGTHEYQKIGTTYTLSKGFHTLTLWYYDVVGLARVSFKCDPDILMWNP